MRDCAYCWGFVLKIKKQERVKYKIKTEQDGKKQIRHALKQGWGFVQLPRVSKAEKSSSRQVHPLWSLSTLYLPQKWSHQNVWWEDGRGCLGTSLHFGPTGSSVFQHRTPLLQLIWLRQIKALKQPIVMAVMV